MAPPLLLLPVDVEVITELAPDSAPAGTPEERRLCVGELWELLDPPATMDLMVPSLGVRLCPEEEEK